MAEALVERETDLSDRDAESLAAVSSDQRDGSFGPKAKLLAPSDCDDAVDGAKTSAKKSERWGEKSTVMQVSRHCADDGDDFVS